MTMCVMGKRPEAFKHLGSRATEIAVPGLEQTLHAGCLSFIPSNAMGTL